MRVDYTHRHRLYVVFKKAPEAKFDFAISNFGDGIQKEQYLDKTENAGARKLHLCKIRARKIRNLDSLKQCIQSTLEGYITENLKPLYAMGEEVKLDGSLKDWEQMYAQTVGNCSIYNLQQAVKWAWQLTHDEHARMNTALLFGADHLLCEEAAVWPEKQALHEAQQAKKAKSLRKPRNRRKPKILQQRSLIRRSTSACRCFVNNPFVVFCLLEK